jgi:tRNA threonylcarbamoyl adenosine modification protein YjeE
VSPPADRSARWGSERATRAAAGRLAARLASGLASGAVSSVFVALDGALGAGKTAFVRGFVAGLGAARERLVSSPTYAIVHVYPGDPEVRHVDLYRVETAADLDAIGWRDVSTDPGVVLVEWSSRAAGALPAARIEIRLAAPAEGVREIHALVTDPTLEALIADWPSRARSARRSPRTR